MERSDAVTVILARVMKMIDRLGEGPGSLAELGGSGALIPIPIRAGRVGERPTPGRIATDRDGRVAIASRNASRW
jgi:hypothetical protein